jgi:DNA-directed RNA polymerase alpha subunit
MGQLAMVRLSDACSWRNLGRKTLREFESLLDTSGLSFGTVIRNWPNDDELEKLLQADRVAERGTGEHGIDFETATDEVQYLLLKPVDTWKLSKRARNVFSNKGIRVMGQLAMVRVSDACRWRNLGRKTLREFESLLDTGGLSFGTVIRNWPNDDELEKLLQNRASTDLDCVRLPSTGIEFLEDEFCVVVENAVDPRCRAIFLRRSGWDGGASLPWNT